MKVQFEIQIHGTFAAASSLDKWLHREVDLPFPPFPGLEVSDGNWSAIVETVWVDLITNVIYAFPEPDKTIYYAVLHNWDEKPEMDDIVADYIEYGWQLVGGNDG